MTFRFVRVAHAIALFLCAAGLAFGQNSTGTISGRILDSTGAAVAGAEVRAINQVDRSSRTFTSTATGDFTFTNLPPGTYTISVKAAGFKELDKRDLHLTEGDSLGTGELRLEVGAVSETVDVVAEGAVVQTESGDRTQLIDSTEVMDMMARGRDVMAMLQILPGVINDNTGSDVLGQYSTPTMSGGRSFYNALNIDGISGNTARGRTAESPINLDSIAEVKVLQNSYPAEYGPSASGVINLVTKSGTQQFHGSVYYYNRNEAFNANNFFNNRQGIPRQRYRFNTVGETLGGPIYIPKHFNTSRQKLFFYFSQEIDPNQVPNSISTFTVPTALERQGNFSQSYKNATTLYTVNDPLNLNSAGKPIQFPDNIIPASRMDPNSAKLLSVFPLPNQTNTAITNFAYNYQVAGSEDEPVLQEILKVDYNINDRAKAWFRASGYSSENNGLSSPAINNKWGPAPVDYKQTMPNLGANFTYVFSPTLVNEALFGMNLWTESQVLTQQGLANYQRATYGINIAQSYPSDNPLGLLPAMSFGGVSKPAQITYDGRFPMVDDSTAFTFSDGLTKVWNAHTFKTGFKMQHALYNQYHQAGGANFPGNFAFGTDSNNPLDSGYAYANAFLGYYDTYTEATNRVNYQPITRVYEWYVQDHWKIARRLSLDLGVRFTDGLPLSPGNDHAGNFVPYLYNPGQAPVLFRPEVVNGKKVVVNPLTGDVVPNVYSGLIVPGTGNPTNGIITPTTPGYPRAMVYSNGVLPAPRLGFAWDIFGDAKTVLRGGGGFFYTPLLDAGTLGNLFFNPPAIYNPTAYYGTVATAANASGLLSPSSFSRDIDPHAKTVTAYQANLGIQRQLGWGTVLDVAYVGNFGRHLGEVVQLNEVPYGADFLPSSANPQGGILNENFFRPYAGYNGIPQQIFQGNSSYHSLQVQAQRRFAKNLLFGVSYTRSKAMDYAEGDSTSTSGEGGSNEVATYLNRRVWNYGIANYDRPNVLSIHFVWSLPKLSALVPNRVVRTIFDDWRISDITIFESGTPLSVSMGESPSINLTGGGDGARPLMVGNPNGPHTFYNWFNAAAFAEPVQYAGGACPASGCPPLSILNIGDMPTFPIRGPRMNNFSTALFKEFHIRERLAMLFRAEAYNAFNHTQFSGVDTTITYNASGVNTRSSTGNLTSARDPRVMQFALRLQF
ncbi:MAG TPA: carboxypeptidase regulatory-like domain-containing protein [Bryobacteraceae bacterium]|jgi:hypothetical protein|nr:carboxypeptidase regulatory-like domain-containing protein [Bryobacteraceae bacterium]